MKKSTNKVTLFDVSSAPVVPTVKDKETDKETEAVTTDLFSSGTSEEPATPAVDTAELSLKLNRIIPELHDSKKMEAMYKARNNEMSEGVKALFSQLSIKEFATDCGITASVSVSQKEELDIEKLADFLIPKDIPGLITMVPTINMEVLEAEIYKGTIPAAELAPFKTLGKPVVKLYTKEPKASKKKS